MQYLRNIWFIFCAHCLCGIASASYAQQAVKDYLPPAVFADSMRKPGVDTTIRRHDTTAAASHKDTATAPRQLTVEELRKLYPPNLVNTLIYDFFATANAMYYENAFLPDQHNELNFQYNITVNNSFQYKKLTLRCFLYNEYSVRSFIDSITIKGLDNIQVRYGAQWPLTRDFSLQANFAARSQIWPTYDYRDDGNNGQERYLYSDYFSPGYLTYSGGFCYSFLDNALISLGLASGRTTKVRNAKLFDSRGVTRLYGVDTGGRTKVSYGLNLILSVPPQMLNKHIGWECNTSVFAERRQLGRLKGYTIDLSNAFHYVFLKNLRLTVRTTLQYDETVRNKIYMMNALLIGFYLSNKI